MEPSAEPCADVFHFTSAVLAWTLCTLTEKGAAGTSDWKKKSNNEMCKICTSYYMIWRIMIWYDKIWYDMIYDIWYMIYDNYMVYGIWYGTRDYFMEIAGVRFLLTNCWYQTVSGIWYNNFSMLTIYIPRRFFLIQWKLAKHKISKISINKIQKVNFKVQNLTCRTRCTCDSFTSRIVFLSYFCYRGHQ